jgi:hypothetical protein
MKIRRRNNTSTFHHLIFILINVDRMSEVYRFSGCLSFLKRMFQALLEELPGLPNSLFFQYADVGA